MQSDLAPLGGAVGQQQHVANLAELQRRAANARLVDQQSGIEQAVKIKAAAGAQVSAQLFRELLLPLDPGSVLRGRRVAYTRSRPSGEDVYRRQQLAKLIEFQHALAGVLAGAREKTWSGLS